ncbi:protein NLRC3 isoform X1 [Austrofundulus limnaeus]|uniref:Protein NLRC3 isoform X1 n=1 Tax=Austrofundulus limnaeus TaxID=52670 RepID=A0A2I4B6V1_AUSLI|nr:PREDICTED: protein NLRC3-like isoform X1 [Austrofundulus limnaeus]
MDRRTDVQNTAAAKNDDDEERYKRPPSSYGSMKSDSESSEEEGEKKGEAESKKTVFVLSDPPAAPAVVGSRQMYSAYTETVHTEATQQTKPTGAFVIDTGNDEPEESTESDMDEDDERLVTCSPEPPEPLEMEDPRQVDEHGQPGRFHPEQDLPHIFKSMQSTLSRLDDEDLFKFKLWFHKWQPSNVIQQVMEGDLLDFVDKAIEIHGADKALFNTINTLQSMEKKDKAAELQNQCQKALLRFHLKSILFRKHQVIHEGVVQAGKQSLLNNVYVEQQLSTCGFGGVDPSHEFPTQPPTPVQVPSEDTFVSVSNLFRLQKEDGSPVRTVVTTGIPGVGMSVSVAKFCLDWAEQRANRDLQYVIKLSFQSLWSVWRRSSPPEKMSIFGVIEYYYSDIKYTQLLEEENTKFLIIMDSFDCYQANLDWEKTPVLNDNNTKAHIDVLVVNLLRGNLLRGARLWILGRRAAVSQIPSHFIDVCTELQGFSDEMKDEYLTKRFSNAELAQSIVRHYKRVPTLHILARHPFVCWIVATMFGRSFCYEGYGRYPPRLTPFLIHILIVQTNRRLKFYYHQMDNDLKWSDTEKQLLTKMGKLALRMLERSTGVFFEEDVKELDLELREVVVWSGLCTELRSTGTPGKRTFCFFHYTVQEFMAALYVFLKFYLESKNVLESSSRFNRSAAGLVQCALSRTLSCAPGHYDMFLRYLCGLLSPACHHSLLRGFLFRHNTPKVTGLEEVERLLEQAAQNAPAGRRQSLKECLREMSQNDD